MSATSRPTPAEPAAIAELRAEPGLRLDSGFWVDRPDALARVDERLRAGELTPESAERLRQFIVEGYCVFHLDGEDERFERFLAAVDRLWRDKPHDLFYACDSPPKRMSRATPDERRRRSRIHDPHSHIAAARELYLDARLHEFAGLVMGDDVLAIQSLYFEYGSEQAIHRDPIVVPTGAHGHLLAAWIALEEIVPECGPLVYVPRSHHLPYYEFSPGEYRFDGSRMGADEANAAMRFFDDQCAKFGLAPRAFTARKGDVLFWHASLAHGGSPVLDPARTRRSFVVHFSIAATYPRRDIRLADDDRGGVWETREILEAGGARGYQNPALGAPRAD